MVVCVRNSIQTIPASAAGSAEMMMKRIEPGLEIHHDQQINQQEWRTPGRASRPTNEDCIVAIWPRTMT